MDIEVGSMSMVAKEMSKCSSYFDIFIFGEIDYTTLIIFFYIVSCNGALRDIYVYVCWVCVKCIYIKNYLHIYI